MSRFGGGRIGVSSSSVPPGTYVPVADVGEANGVAALDSEGVVPESQLPPDLFDGSVDGGTA